MTWVWWCGSGDDVGVVMIWGWCGSGGGGEYTEWRSWCGDGWVW